MSEKQIQTSDHYLVLYFLDVETEDEKQRINGHSFILKEYDVEEFLTNYYDVLTSQSPSQEVFKVDLESIQIYELKEVKNGS